MKWLGLLFLLLIHLLILNNLNFTAWPEMLTYPYLLSNNFSLYKDFIMPYPPFLVLILKMVFEYFGYSIGTLKSLTWLLILSLDVIIYFILTNLINKKIIIIFFLSIFILLQSFLDGNMLWFDFVTVIPVCLAFLFSIKWINSKKNVSLYLVGLMFGVAVFIKQISLVYVSFFFIFLLIFSFRKIIKSSLILFLGILTTILPFLIYLIAAQSLIYFWNWTIYYPLAWWSKFPGYVDFNISRNWVVVTLLLLAPSAALIFNIKNLLKEKVFMLNFLLLIAAILAVYPRFSFFHLQPTIALAVLLYAQVYLFLNKEKKSSYLILVSISALLIVGLTYHLEVGNSVRFSDSSEKELTKKIIKYTLPREKIYLLGPISSQYVFGNRLPPKNWSDNFGWYLEIPGVQEWVLSGFITDRPQYIFRQSPEQGRWYELGVYQPKKIVDFIYANYDKQENFNKIEIWKRKN